VFLYRTPALPAYVDTEHRVHRLPLTGAPRGAAGVMNARLSVWLLTPGSMMSESADLVPRKAFQS